MIFLKRYVTGNAMKQYEAIIYKCLEDPPLTLGQAFPFHMLRSQVRRVQCLANE